MFKHILVPTDGSELAKTALRKAVRFAKTVGAEVTQVIVDEPFQILAVDDPMIYLQTQEQYLEATRKRAEVTLKSGEEHAQSEGVKISSLHIYHPVIYQGITETAKKNGCDLIFMASHGRRGIAAVVLGSTTHKVLAHTALPVMVWRSVSAVPG
jgi:nucleotide-binding universal stress UspA family protein